jgi:hypothetical protein
MNLRKYICGRSVILDIKVINDLHKIAEAKEYKDHFLCS